MSQSRPHSCSGGPGLPLAREEFARGLGGLSGPSVTRTEKPKPRHPSWEELHREPSPHAHSGSPGLQLAREENHTQEIACGLGPLGDLRILSALSATRTVGSRPRHRAGGMNREPRYLARIPR